MDNLQNKEIELRNEQANIYDDIFLKTRGKYWSRAQINLVLHYLDLKKNQKILDAGCGTGIYSTEILKKNENIKIDAVDFSESEIRIFKNKLSDIEKEKVKISVGDLLDFEYPESEYDRVMLIEVLQHIPDEKKRLEIIKKLYNSIKPNGMLITVNYLWGGFIKPPHIKEDFNFNNTGLYRFAFTDSDLNTLFNISGFSKTRNIKIIRTPYSIRKSFPDNYAFSLEHNFIRFNLFNSRAKYLLTIGYK